MSIGRGSPVLACEKRAQMAHRMLRGLWGRSKAFCRPTSARSPVVPFYPFLGGGFLYQNRVQKIGYPYSSPSTGGPSLVWARFSRNECTVASSSRLAGKKLQPPQHRTGVSQTGLTLVKHSFFFFNIYIYITLVWLEIDGTGLDWVYSIYQGRLFFHQVTTALSKHLLLKKPC